MNQYNARVLVIAYSTSSITFMSKLKAFTVNKLLG